MIKPAQINSVRPRPGLHDSVTTALLDIISEHRPVFPTLDQIAARAEQDPEAVHKVFGSVQDVLDTLAEQGLMKLFDSFLRTVTQVPPDDPVAQFRALGTAYLTWAFENPAQFRLLQLGKLVDIQGNEKLARYVRSMQDLMTRLLARAKENQQLPADTDDQSILLAGRCLLFGLARMAIEEDMLEWHPGMSAQDAAVRAFEDYVNSVASTSGRRSSTRDITEGVA